MSRWIGILTGAWLLAAPPAWAGEREIALENSALEVKFDPSSGHFSVADKAAHQVFVKDGWLSADPGEARLATITDKIFGAGQAIQVTHSSGDREAILLFPDLPFVLFRSTLHNAGAESTMKNKVRTFSGILDLGAPTGELKTLGTGGLLAADKNPGSYVWLAIAEPRSRRGVVGGWLTHDRGSGIVFSGIENGAARMDAQIDHGRLRIAPGKDARLETFAVGYFDDARLGLEAWADALARNYKIKLHPQPAGFCTWYSKPFGAASDEKHLAELSEFAATNLAPFGFSVVQIDDHWQAGVSTNGPKRNFTTHAPAGPYPGGMKAIAGKIKSLGLTPGLWFMPFAGTYYDPFFQDHQDWFVKREDGRPYETDWGGTCLDMTQPGARKYLQKNVRRIAHDWGFEYFKMDGLWTGTATRQIYVNTGYQDEGMGDAVFHDPDKTGIEAYQSGLKLVREAAGKDVFFLGCCAPQNMRSYGAAMGSVDAMRIGPDNGTDWNDLLNGPTFGSRHYFLHGRVWYNDPDPIYTRASLPPAQARLICSWVTISGQMNLSSEWFPGLPPERLDILKRTLPSHGLRPRPVDLFDEPLPRIWLLTDERRSPRRDVIGLFNWDDTEKTFNDSVERIGLAAGTEYLAFDYWQDKMLPVISGHLQVTVPGRSCCVLAVRPCSDHPQLLSTSRHITQGIVDVLEEKWDATGKILSGRSRLVAGDPYELRIAAVAPGMHWGADSIELSSADKLAKVRATVTQDGDLIRARLDSPISREVVWSVKFAFHQK